MNPALFISNNVLLMTSDFSFFYSYTVMKFNIFHYKKHNIKYYKYYISGNIFCKVK